MNIGWVMMASTVRLKAAKASRKWFFQGVTLEQVFKLRDRAFNAKTPKASTILYTMYDCMIQEGMYV